MERAHSLAAEAARLATAIPADVLDIAGEALFAAADVDAARRTLTEAISHPVYRRLIDKFTMQAAREDVSPMAIGLALLTAGHAERAHRASQQVEVVWTGPDSDAVPFRRTEQVILQILDSAQTRITLVSYAVYAIPRIREALVRAASRGVRITVVVETPDKVSSESEYSTLRALGADVASCSTVYYWPIERRPRDGGKAGILHVKSVIADGRWLFVSSANLTEYAFSINMELGVLLTGGRMPAATEALFDDLVATGTLVRI